MKIYSSESKGCGTRLLLLPAAFALFLASLTLAGSLPELNALAIKYDPYPAEAGAYFDIWIKIENNGVQAAEEVSVLLEPGFPFALDPDDPALKGIGTLSSGQQAIVHYKVRVDNNAVDGDNLLKYSYKTGDSAWSSKEANIVVESEKADLRIGNIESSPVRLVSDTEDAKLSVSIDNIGEVDARSVLAKLVLPPGLSPSQSYSDIANLGSIAKDGSATAVFYIDIDKSVPAREHPATLEIEYKSGSKDPVKRSLEILIPVKPVAVFEIENVSTNPAKIAQGDENIELRIRVKNTGSRKAESVSVKIFKAADQPFDFTEKSDYIGTLKEGSSGDALLKFSVDKNAGLKTYLLSIEIRSVEENDVRLSEHTVAVKVENSKEEQNYTLFLLAGAAIICIYFGYVRRENGRKKRKGSA